MSFRNWWARLTGAEPQTFDMHYSFARPAGVVNLRMPPGLSKEAAERVLDEFGIGIGKMAGIAEDGIEFDDVTEKGGIARVTLLGWTDRAQIDRILGKQYAPDEPSVSLQLRSANPAKWRAVLEVSSTGLTRWFEVIDGEGSVVAVKYDLGSAMYVADTVNKEGASSLALQAIEARGYLARTLSNMEGHETVTWRGDEVHAVLADVLEMLTKEVAR